MAHLLVDRCLRQDEGGARRNKRKAEADAEQGLVFEAENLKVGEYLDKWLADSVRDTVRQRTYERYESIVRVHIKPPIGWVKLMALTPAHVRALYRKTLDDGLAPRTVNYIHVTLHKALSQAVSDGLVQRNVASVKAPPAGEARDQAALPGAGPQAHSYGARDRGSLRGPYVLALHCGLREGELLGLKWDDVDLSGTTAALQVRRTLSETRTGHKFEKPKNGKGRSYGALRMPQKPLEATAHGRTGRGLGSVLSGKITASCSRPRRAPP
jgi:integrase